MFLLRSADGHIQSSWHHRDSPTLNGRHDLSYQCRIQCVRRNCLFTQQYRRYVEMVLWYTKITRRMLCRIVVSKLWRGAAGLVVPAAWSTILVIAIPFRKGHHVAKHPGDFLPIIDHLEKLHDAGYVCPRRHQSIQHCV